MDDDDAAEVALPLKVLVLGDPAVGKTAYVSRLVPVSYTHLTLPTKA